MTHDFALSDDVLFKILEALEVRDVSSFSLVCKRFNATHARSIWTDKYNDTALSCAYGPASLHSTPFLRLYLTRLSKLDSAFANPDVALADYKHDRYAFTGDNMSLSKDSTIQGRLLFYLRNDSDLCCCDVENKFKEIWNGKVPTAVRHGLRVLRCSDEILETKTEGVGTITVLLVLEEGRMVTFDFVVAFVPNASSKVEEVGLHPWREHTLDFKRLDLWRDVWSPLHGPWVIQRCEYESRLFHTVTWQQYVLDQPQFHVPLDAVFAENRILSLSRPGSGSSYGSVSERTFSIYMFPDMNAVSSSPSLPTPPQTLHCAYRVKMEYPYVRVVMKHIRIYHPQMIHVFVECNRPHILSLPIPKRGGDVFAEPRIQECPHPTLAPPIIYVQDRRHVGTFGTSVLAAIHQDDQLLQAQLFPLYDHSDGSCGFGKPMHVQMPRTVSSAFGISE